MSTTVKYMIEVTKEDIELGIKTPLSATKCPVFRAMKRIVPKLRSVGVTTARAQNSVFELPTEVAKRIEAFGHGVAGEPFSFEVEGTVYDG